MSGWGSLTIVLAEAGIAVSPSAGCNSRGCIVLCPDGGAGYLHTKGAQLLFAPERPAGESEQIAAGDHEAPAPAQGV